jgi:hypothetical protein
MRTDEDERRPDRSHEPDDDAVDLRMPVREGAARPGAIMSPAICPNIERQPASPSHGLKNSMANALPV